MPSRPGDRTTDLPLIADLVARYETAWFGAPEQDLDELADTLHRIPDWTHDLRLSEDADGRLTAVAWRWQQDLDLLVDHSVRERRPVVHELIDWLASGRSGQLQVLDRDRQLRAELVQAGWRHGRSAFELGREVADGWRPAQPRWPAGVRLIDYRPEQADAVHRLVYVDAGWSAIPGHNERGPAEWQSLFLAEHTNPLPPIVAWQAGRPVGAALTRRFTDGTGWVNQLAVAHDARGQGLGRALLLAALTRLLEAGATRLALGVQAGNPGALRLYVEAGLRVEREYLYFAPPDSNAD